MPIIVDVVLNGDGAWPDLIGGKEGTLEAIGRLTGGMRSGRSSIGFKIRLEDGSRILVQTSMNIFLTAADAMRDAEEVSKLGFGADNDALQTLSALLDPDISTPVILREVSIDPEAVSRSLQTAFDEYALDLNDPWVTKIKAIEENQDLWKLALAATYQVIKGSDRTSVETWNLIAKTYQLLAKNG